MNSRKSRTIDENTSDFLETSITTNGPGKVFESVQEGKEEEKRKM